MPAPTSNDEFLDLVRKSKLVDESRLNLYLDQLAANREVPADPAQTATLLVRDGLLTHFQAEQVLLGKWRKFNIGKYRVLERLGSGGMGNVYLCEHPLMRRLVAIKVLPTARAVDPTALERFYLEARAVAALDHPNIVRAHDVDRDEQLYFLVMEHIDGSNLQEIVRISGPMDPVRASHYIRQAAFGLQHAHEAAGLIHRDIKPGNILVDRNGVVKVLDMGLGRFFDETEDDLVARGEDSILGTADYVAPEQAVDSSDVDIRADIYSLGATFYFLLTARTPFLEGTVAQKLIWHQTRKPKALRLLRPELPAELIAIVEKMMAKDKTQRFQNPAQVAEALSALDANGHTRAVVGGVTTAELGSARHERRCAVARGRRGFGACHAITQHPQAILAAFWRQRLWPVLQSAPLGKPASFSHAASIANWPRPPRNRAASPAKIQGVRERPADSGRSDDRHTRIGRQIRHDAKFESMSAARGEPLARPAFPSLDHPDCIARPFPCGWLHSHLFTSLTILSN